MSSTYVSKRAVVRISHEADPFVVLFNETCESNVFPQTPHWSCWFFGRLSAAIKKIISGSYYYEGGCVKGARGRAIKPESDLAAWRTAFKTASAYHRQTIELQVRRKYASIDINDLIIRARAIKEMCESVGSTVVLQGSIEPNAYFTFDLQKPEDLLAIDRLVNQKLQVGVGSQHPDNTMAYPWYLFESIYPNMPDASIALPALPKKHSSRHELVKVTLRPYANQTAYETHAHLVTIDGRVVSEDAFRWTCSNELWHAGATDEIKGAMLAMAACRDQLAGLAAVDQNDVDLVAEPLDVSDLSSYRLGQYQKLGIGSTSTRIKPEFVASALDMLDSGLVLHVISDTSDMDASDTQAVSSVQESLEF